MSTPENKFANAFYHEFSQNGETGIPNVFVKTEATEGVLRPSITEEEFIDARRLLQDKEVEIRMEMLDYSANGARALFKTAMEIPAEVLEQLKSKNHLGRVALGSLAA